MVVIFNCTQIVLHKSDNFGSVHGQLTALMSEALLDYHDTIGPEQSANAVAQCNSTIGLSS